MVFDAKSEAELNFFVVGLNGRVCVSHARTRPEELQSVELRLYPVGFEVIYERFGLGISIVSVWIRFCRSTQSWIVTPVVVEYFEVGFL